MKKVHKKILLIGSGTLASIGALLFGLKKKKESDKKKEADAQMSEKGFTLGV